MLLYLIIKRNDYQAWYNLGNSLFNLKKYQDAIASYNKAIRYKPDSYETWYSRGNALYSLKRYQEAIASYEQAIKFKADYKEAIDARNVTQGLLQAEKSKLPLIPNF
jgi:tetratricopeptide (TPR) repeat protein